MKELGDLTSLQLDRRPAPTQAPERFMADGGGGSARGGGTGGGSKGKDSKPKGSKGGKGSKGAALKTR
jgi:hypothetical protein